MNSLLKLLAIIVLLPPATIICIAIIVMIAGLTVETANIIQSTPLPEGWSR